MHVFSVITTGNYFSHSNISHSEFHQFDVKVEVSEEVTNCSQQEYRCNTVCSLSSTLCIQSNESYNIFNLNDITQDTPSAHDIVDCEYKQNPSEVENNQPADAENVNIHVSCAEDKHTVFDDSERCEFTPNTNGE